MASPRNQHCANCLGILPFPMTSISYRTLTTSSLTVPSQTADSRQLTVASIDKPSANFDLQWSPVAHLECELLSLDDLRRQHLWWLMSHAYIFQSSEFGKMFQNLDPSTRFDTIPACDRHTRPLIPPLLSSFSYPPPLPFLPIILTSLPLPHFSAPSSHFPLSHSSSPSIPSLCLLGSSQPSPQPLA